MLTPVDETLPEKCSRCSPFRREYLAAYQSAVEDGSLWCWWGLLVAAKVHLRLIAGLEELTGGNICVGDR